MQVSRVSKKSQKSLRQGTIFSISKLKFPKLNTKGNITFSKMYKEVGLKGITYGIVLSQSCDLVDSGSRKIKTPYITIALLEPIEKYLEATYKEKLLEDIQKASLDFTFGNKKFKFLNRDKFLDSISSGMAAIFQNNDKFFFFITIPQGKKSRLFMVNLTKSFPIKSEHSKLLYSKANFQLRPFFENKLGWKIAEIYGRVGTPDYEKEELVKLTYILWGVIETKLNIKLGIKIDKENFSKAQNLTKRSEQEKEIFFTNLMSKIGN